MQHNDSKKNPPAMQKQDDTVSGSNIMTDREKKLQEELNQMTAIAKRALADIDNFKKSLQEEKKRGRQEEKISILKDFLGLLDSFERASVFFEKLPEEHQKGIETIYQQLKQIFEKYGVKEIEAQGQKVNFQFHEPIMQDEGPEGIVLKVLEKGYTMDNLLLRPAKVKIGKQETLQRPL